MKKLLLLAAAVVGVASTSHAGVKLNVGFGVPLPPVPIAINYRIPCAPACPPRVVVPCRPPVAYHPPVCRPTHYGYDCDHRNYSYSYGGYHRDYDRGYDHDYGRGYGGYDRYNGQDDSHGYRR